MSYTRVGYDPCTYRHELVESIGPGDYMVNTPTVECSQCTTNNPYVQPNRKYGNSYSKNSEWVDVQSELLGITRPLSKCPEDGYRPGSKYDIRVSNEWLAAEGDGKQSECDRFLQTEDTLISNPPCTLRGTGINRFEFLHENPQDNAIRSFDRVGVQMRLVARDNHRPCIPKPLASLNNEEILAGSGEKLPEIPLVENGYWAPPTTAWKNCSEIY